MRDILAWLRNGGVAPAQPSSSTVKPAIKPAVQTIRTLPQRPTNIESGPARPKNPEPEETEEVPLQREVRTARRAESNPQDLDGWREVLDTTDINESGYQRAFDEALKLSTTLEDIVWLYDRVDTDDSSSPLLRQVIAKVGTCSGSCDEFAEVYSDRSDLDDFSSALLAKAMSLAKTPDEWIDIWDKAASSSDDDLDVVKKALKEVKFSREEWESFRDDGTENEDDQRAFADLRLVQFHEGDSVSELLEFYIECYGDEDNDDRNDDMLKEISDRIFAKATRQEVQIIEAMASWSEKSELEEAAAEFLKS